MSSDNIMFKESKALSWLLRHGAPKIKCSIDDEGFVELNDIVKLSKMHKNLRVLENMTLKDYETLVNNNNKSRFHLTLISGQENNKENMSAWKIRANQGHSFDVPNLELEVIKPVDVPYVVHGTDKDSWDKILKSGHLSVMSRSHMHFTEEKDFEKLGRKNCKIVLKFDVTKAYLDGIKFYRAKNNVILSKGINGKLSLDYLVSTP